MSKAETGVTSGLYSRQRQGGMMKITGTMMAQVEIDKRQLGYAIMQEVSDRCGNPDDAGCDWYTDDEGNTYIAGDPDWRVSLIHDTAALVDAANILRYGSALKMAKVQVPA